MGDIDSLTWENTDYGEWRLPGDPYLIIKRRGAYGFLFYEWFAFEGSNRVGSGRGNGLSATARDAIEFACRRNPNYPHRNIKIPLKRREARMKEPLFSYGMIGDVHFIFEMPAPMTEEDIERIYAREQTVTAEMQTEAFIRFHARLARNQLEDETYKVEIGQKILCSIYPDESRVQYRIMVGEEDE